MYERPDVPKPGKNRTVLAACVLAAIGLAFALGLPALWRLANETNASTLGDDSLQQAVQGPRNVLQVPEGAEATGNDVETFLVLTVDDIRADAPALQTAELLCVDHTAKKSCRVTLPSDLPADVDGSSRSLGDLFSSQGEGACVAPVSAATGLAVSHVVELDGDGWALFERAMTGGVQGAAQAGPELVSSLKTDMDTGQLMDLPESLSGTGVSAAELQPCPMAEGGSEVDRTALGVLAGTLRQ
ncbi:hypothetical protein AAK967_04885 [Atopobiaceae bacterium 24-176]